MFVGLDGAEGVQQLADEHGKPDRHGHKQVDNAERPELVASLADGLNDFVRDVSRLAWRMNEVWIRSFFGNFGEGLEIEEAGPDWQQRRARRSMRRRA